MFIAINPRFSGNVGHYDEIMSTLDRFKALSRNQVSSGAYIHPASAATNSGREPFYDDQQQIAAAAFPGRPFADVACSAEMYFCASKDGDALVCDNSPCAKRYLRRIIENHVQPDLIVTFGTRIPFFFRTHLKGIAPKVMHLPFRSNLSADKETMDRAVRWAARSTTAFFHGHSLPPRDWTWPTDDAPEPLVDYLNSQPSGGT